jgi:hypothetical protein
MYTYMSYSGFGYSPFGYMYYSPATVGYAPYYGGSGYSYGASPSHLTAVSSRLGALATHRAENGLMASARSFGGGRSSGGSSFGGSSFSGGHVGSASIGGGGHGGGGHR